MSINNSSSKSQAGKGKFDFSLKDIPSSKGEINSDIDLEIEFKEYLDSIPPDNSSKSHSNKSIKKAGRSLRNNTGDLKNAAEIIRDFRANHQRPLETVYYVLSKLCERYKLDVTYAKRLKRLETIIDKLQRKSLDGIVENNMCVTNMNDIGGCRVILDNICSLNRLRQGLPDINRLGKRLQIIRTYDYINNPRKGSSGYRSLHIIFLYQNKVNKKFRIEAQIRTVKQHIWATAVEIIDVVENLNIKTGWHEADKSKSETQVKWEELLHLASDLIAEEEGVLRLGCSEKNEMVHRLGHLIKELNAITRLRSFKIANEKHISFFEGGSNYKNIVLVVNEKEQRVELKMLFDNTKSAIRAYGILEKTYSNYDEMNVLLVSVDSVSNLAKTYPNYVGDCERFVEVLQRFN